MDILDQLRCAIRHSGETRYAISKKTGIDQATLSRFLAGKQGLSTRSLSALSRFLAIKLTRADEGQR